MDYDRLRELQEKFDENPRRYFAPLANEYRKGGQPKRAIEICRSHLAQMPGHMSGQIVYGQSLYEAGEFDEAREVFGRALALDPENLIALRSLGDMSLQAGNTSEARSWYMRLLEADPKDMAVIALVSEIDAAADATPVAMSTEIPGIDVDAGDQQIPAVIEETPELETPAGLERHYPVEESPSEEAPAQALGSEGPRAEEVGAPAGDSAAEGLTSVVPDAPSPLDWAPPPAQSEEKTFTGASPEPFVNETMAQLYLQQGYKQLALQVYRQLAVSRPQDEGLRSRIAEIEAADAAAHPGEAPAEREEEKVPKRESVDAPTRDEPRAEPDGIAARQPSIREFFATLGRRRPPRPSSSGGSRSGNNQPADTRAPLGAAAPSASLDTVFAGATVSPSDARAASRLAGAFSGATGSSRTNPPTPPVPTPRVNPRVPQTQESEEDVAKFRAWLDGLTGE
jgi:tetratricopeptide (TPR) repeat protein